MTSIVGCVGQGNGKLIVFAHVFVERYILIVQQLHRTGAIDWYVGHRGSLGRVVSSPWPLIEALGFEVVESNSFVAGCSVNVVHPISLGHAIWIGNLPPQTDLMELVHHVVKEAPGLESLFLISKSNCAFANFQDEATCAAAQQKLHDSKFQSVRLVSRLRKSTVEGALGVTAPTGPAASTPPGSSTQNVGGFREGAGGTVLNGSTEMAAAVPTKSSNAETKSNAAPVIHDMAVQRDRYFVLKSLTVEDLELSVRTKVWATQSHNEETLNNAFKVRKSIHCSVWRS